LDILCRYNILLACVIN